jgi:siroheme synthase-like protein
MPHTYPMMLDVADRLIVIVGGGAVAVRKAKTLIQCGATRVRCIAPSIDDAMPAEVERGEKHYDSHDLDGAGLVFAATDDSSVNATVLRDARQMKILVNRADADEADPGDFATPAQFRQSAVTVTVSAGGNPALAGMIRDGIRDRWDARWSLMSEAMKSIRPMLLARTDLAQERRSEIFRALATPAALDVLSGGGPDALTMWLAGQFPEIEYA